MLLLVDCGHRSNVGFKGISKIFLGIVCRIDFSSYRFTGYFIFVRKVVSVMGLTRSLGGGYVRVSHIFKDLKNWALSQFITTLTDVVISTKADPY